MPQWSAFVGVTGLVLTGFLLLARLSQRVVEDAERVTQDADPVVGDVEGTTEDAESVGDRRPTEVRDRPPAEPSPADAREPGSNDGSPQPAERADGPADGSLLTDPTTGPPVSPAHPASTEPPTRSLSPGTLLANVAVTQGLFGGLLAAAAWYFGIPGSALGLGAGRVEGALALLVGAGFGVALWVGNEVASALADAAGATYDEGLRALLTPADARGWVLLLGGTLPIIAVVEEFLFRAAAIGATSAGFGVSPWALAVVSSAGFAVGHGAQGRVGVAVTGALGFALAAGYVLTGSLLVVVVAHYLVNALEFGLHEGVGLPDPVWSSPGGADSGE